MTTTAHPRSFGPLWDLLFAKFPEHRSDQGILDVPRLAKDIGRSATVLYRALNKDRLDPAKAEALIEASKGALTAEDLRPYVKLGEYGVDVLKKFA